MAEFQDQLAPPGNLPRAVQTEQRAPDVFGAVADLWRGLSSAGNKTVKGPSEAEQRQQAEEMGLDTFAAGAHSIMTGDTEGAGANVLAYFGIRAKPMFDEMGRVQDAADGGELTPTEREVQLERLVSGVMGKYPEASYEIMGQALGALGIDHSYARAWKATQAQRDAAIADEIKAETTAYEAAAGAGITGPRNYMIGQGKKLLRDKHNMGAYKEWLDIENMLADKNAQLSEAQAAGLKATQAQIGDTVVNSAIQAASAGFQPFLETLQGLTATAGVDPESQKLLQELYSRTRMDLLSGKAAFEQNFSSLMADPALKTHVDKWFADQSSVLDALQADTSGRMQQVLTTIQTAGKIDAAQIAPVYQQLNDVFGQGMVMAIFQGTVAVEGLSQNELKGLQQELAEGFKTGSLNAEQARAKVASYQAALDGTAIPKIADEGKRGEAINAAVKLMPVTLAPFAPGSKTPLTETDFRNFNGNSVSLMSAALADAPTITVENANKVIPLIASSKWRAAAKQYVEKGGDPDSAKKMVQYNTVVTATMLDTFSRSFVETGGVRWNDRQQRYEATPLKDFYVAEGTPFHAIASAGEGPGTQENQEAASIMNSLISHLEQTNTNIVEFVGSEYLVSQPDANGATEKMSVKDVFATDDGFMKSVMNFSQFQSETETPQAVRDQWFEQARSLVLPKDEATGLLQPPGYMFDFSAMGRNAAAVEARVRMASMATNAGPKQSVFAPTDFNTYVEQMFQTEGGGTHTGTMAHDPTRSSAKGRFGFIDGTWTSYVDKLVPGAASMTKAQKIKLMEDPALELQIMEAFTMDNYAALEGQLGRAPSWEELNIAHLLGTGPTGAGRFLKALAADPEAKAADVLPAAVVKANPELTKGSVLDLWNLRLRRKDADWDTYMTSRQGIAPQMPAQNMFADISLEDLLVQ